MDRSNGNVIGANEAASFRAPFDTGLGGMGEGQLRGQCRCGLLQVWRL